MQSNKLIIKKHNKGIDGHRVFSIRIKDDLADQLEDLAHRANISRNEVIVQLLEYGIHNSEIESED